MRDQIAKILDPKFAAPAAGGGGGNAGNNASDFDAIDSIDLDICWPDYAVRVPPQQ